MKLKKLLAFIVIVSTLLVCYTISISANDIWNGKSVQYVIEGTTFAYLNNEYPIDFSRDIINKAYINVQNQKFDIVERIDYQIYKIFNYSTEQTFDIDIEGFDIYISYELYHYWYNEEGYFPILATVNTEGLGAKEVFNTVTETSTQIAFNLFNNLWNNGLTFWGWIIVIGFSLITTFNIIKMIRNSL